MFRLSPFALALVAVVAILAVPAAQADFIDQPIKWSQQPDMENGGDRLSIHASPATGEPPVVADDYLCETEDPIGAVRWWGSYLGYDGDPPPDYEPPAGGAKFHIRFFTDVPKGPDNPFSHPGELLLDQIVYAQEEVFGTVPDPETVFMYNARLRIPFEQKEYGDPAGEPTVFWICIDRVDREDWGWHEGFPQAPWVPDDVAVTGPHSGAGPWSRLLKVKDPEMRADMAFELLVPEPSTLVLLASGGLLLLLWRRRKPAA